MKARRVNSPASASLALDVPSMADKTDLTTAGPPWPCISTISSPVHKIHSELADTLSLEA